MAVPLTFAPFAAGLNNQKLALVGLALEARDQRRSLLFPPLLDYTVGDDAPAHRVLGDILDRDHLTAALARFGVDVVANAAAEALDPNVMMARGSEALTESRRAGDMPHFDRYTALLGAMRPAPPIAARAERIGRWLAGRGIDTGCGMRIERDWLYWTRLHRADIRVDPAEQLYFDHAAILAKIAVSLPQARALYVTTNEDDLPVTPDEIRQHAGSAHGIDIVFRSDVPDAGADGPLAGAAMNFAVALGLPRFVGHTRSSYFGVLGLAAHGAGLAAEHWLYNNRGPFLKRRSDQGAFVRPWAAANA